MSDKQPTGIGILPIITLLVGGGLGFGGARLLDSSEAGSSQNSENQSAIQVVEAGPQKKQLASTTPSGKTPTVEAMEKDSSSVRSSIGKLEARMRRFEQDPNIMRGMIELSHMMFGLQKDQLPVVFELLKESKNQQAKFMMSVALFSRWGELDPDGAMTAAKGMQNMQLRNQAMQGLLSSWMESDPEKATNYIDNLPDGMEKTQLQMGTFAMLAFKDPKKAAMRALKSENAMLRQQSLQTVGQFWGMSDGAEGLKWAKENIEDVNLRKELEQRILAGWANAEPKKALKYAEGIEDKSVRKEAVRNAVRAWAGSAPEEAIDYLVNLPEDQRDPDAFRNMGWGLGSLSSEKVLDYAEKIEDSESNAAFVSSIVNTRAHSVPHEAAALAELLPEGSQREQSLNTIARNWAGRDAAAASEWLSELPDSLSKDSAIIGFTDVWAKTEPQEALEWAASVQDKNKRQTAVSGVVTKWMEQDREAASEFLQGTDLIPEEVKQMFQQQGS